MKTGSDMAKKLTGILLVFALCIGLTPSAFAGDNIDEWDMGKTKDPNKAWTIEFNESLESSKVNSTTVYVKDENNKRVSTKATLSSDKKSIIVKPIKFYEANKVYKLYLDDSIRSASKKNLKATIVFPFKVLGTEEPEDIETPKQPEQPKNEENNLVTDVDFKVTSYVTIVSLETDNTVAKVKVGSKKAMREMHYEGNNRYSLGMAGLEAGEKVTIQAYDSSEDIVFAKEYTVK